MGATSVDVGGSRLLGAGDCRSRSRSLGAAMAAAPRVVTLDRSSSCGQCIEWAAHTILWHDQLLIGVSTVDSAVSRAGLDSKRTAELSSTAAPLSPPSPSHHCALRRALARCVGPSLKQSARPWWAAEPFCLGPVFESTVDEEGRHSAQQARTGQAPHSAHGPQSARQPARSPNSAVHSWRSSPLQCDGRSPRVFRSAAPVPICTVQRQQQQAAALLGDSTHSAGRHRVVDHIRTR